jgi:hypothetical protein
MKSVFKVAVATALASALLALTGGAVGATVRGPSGGDAPSVTGKVIAVNGDVSVGACGTAGASGNFIIKSGTSKTHLTTVNVTASTSFVEKSVAMPSFANVCVGFQATAIGSNTAHSMNALAVRIFAPSAVNRFGQVTAVNGSSTPGACGTAGARGAFTLNFKVGVSTVVDTVDVYRITKFHDPQQPGATFADVCVGDNAAAEGPSIGNTILAAVVVVTPPKTPTPLHVKGEVSSVNGVSTAGTCGVADTAGEFVVTWTDSHSIPPSTINTTVGVTATTPFAESGVASPTFANICVGGKASVIGTYSSVVLEASAVAAYPPAS